MYTTRSTLLKKICSGDQISWGIFYQTYRPLIIVRGRDFNVSPFQMEDLIQMVMIKIFNHADHFCYDSSKGRFRDYLRAIVSHSAIDIKRKESREKAGRLEYVDCVSSVETDHWEEEWREHILIQALDALREEVEIDSYQAFKLYVLDEVPVETVAQKLDMSVDSIYAAKYRLTKKLRRLAATMEDA